MLPPLEHFPVHWVDGMKISRQHFQQMENALADLIRDGAGQVLHADNYGLLAPVPGMADSFDLQLQNHKLILQDCRAITVGGARIEINRTDEKSPVLEKNLEYLDTQQSSWYVVVSVDLFERKPTGSPNPKESPPRIPFTLPAYDLQIIPSATLPQTAYLPNQVIIGKLLGMGSNFELDTTYIPPSTRMRSHRNLEKVFEEQLKLLSEIVNLATETIQNTYGISQPDNLNKGVRFFSEKVAFHAAGILDRILLNGFNEIPLHFFSNFIQFGRIMEVALNCLPDRDRDLVTQYFSGRIGNKISNFKHHDFDHRIKEFLNQFSYVHEEIHQSAVQPVQDFLSLVYILFQEIAPFEIHSFRDIEIVQKTISPSGLNPQHDEEQIHREIQTKRNRSGIKFNKR